MNKIVIEGSKVTPDQVENAIIAEDYVKLGKKITVCHLTLQNGHEVIGMAGVVDHTQFDMEIGKRFAREKALDEVWKHLGTILQNQLAETKHDRECGDYVRELRKLLNSEKFKELEDHRKNPRVKGFMIAAVHRMGIAEIHVQYTKENGEIVRKVL